MKKKYSVFFVVAGIVFFLSGCASQKAAVEQGLPVEAPLPYWTGDGGTGKSIAILAPKTSGLEENQNYLPDLVQGELVNNFSGFSALNVLDRVNLDEQYAELLSGYYDDTAEAGMDLGHLIPTDFLMTGNIVRTSTGYALQLNIARNADKMTVASYSGTVTFDELDNFSGIRKASLELLEKMGVEPTERARTELAGAATEIHVNAQTALARGINAQRQGTEVAAYSYYIEASSLDPTLLEASNRSSIIAANISSTNIGENARNEVEWRRQWIARLTETEEFFHELFTVNSIPYTLFYSAEIIPGDINFQNETQVLSINTNLRPSGSWTWLTSVERALKDVYDGFNGTGRKDIWGLGDWPRRGVTNLNPFGRKEKRFQITAELVNSDNKVIGRTEFQSGGSWEFNWTNDVSVSGDDRKQVRFTNVSVNDITDSLTVRIASVNGINARRAAETGVLQIKALSKEDWDAYTSFEMRGNTITGYNGEDKNLEIPSVWDEPVIAIGDEAFRNKQQITSLTLTGNVTSIGENALDNSVSILAIGRAITSLDLKPDTIYRDRIYIGENVDITGWANWYEDHGRRAGIYVYTANGMAYFPLGTPEETIAEGVKSENKKARAEDRKAELGRLGDEIGDSIKTGLWGMGGLLLIVGGIWGFTALTGGQM